jgi:DNA-binding NarL/FixJ family response regulator
MAAQRSVVGTPAGKLATAFSPKVLQTKTPIFFLREGIAAIINNQPDILLVAEATNGTEGIERFRKHRPDVTLMDLRLPDMSGVDSLIAIRADFPEARIIMLTTFEGDVEVHRALEAGARAYLLKSMPHKDLVDAIRRVHAYRPDVNYSHRHITNSALL